MVQPASPWQGCSNHAAVLGVICGNRVNSWQESCPPWVQTRSRPAAVSPRAGRTCSSCITSLTQQIQAGTLSMALSLPFGLLVCLHDCRLPHCMAMSLTGCWQSHEASLGSSPWLRVLQGAGRSHGQGDSSLSSNLFVCQRTNKGVLQHP